METTTKQTKPTPAILHRSIAEIGRELVIDAKGNVNAAKGNALTAVELGEWAADKVNSTKSAGVTAANALILARSLPDVKVGDATVPAFCIAQDTLRKNVADGEYYVAMGLVLSLDIIAVEKLPESTSVFTVRDSLGTLFRKGVLPSKKEIENGKKPEFKKVEGKVTKLVEALKDAKNPPAVNRIREIIADVNDKPAKSAAEKKIAADAKEAAEKKAEAERIAATDAEYCNRSLVACQAIWDKAVSKDGVARVRSVCENAIVALARLAGFDVKPLAK